MTLNLLSLRLLLWASLAGAGLVAPTTGASVAIPGSPGAQSAKHEKTEAERSAEATAWFDRRTPEQQKKILAGIRKELDGLHDPYLESLRAFASRAAASPAKKDLEVKTKTAPEGALALAKELPFPVYKEYVFGARMVRSALGVDSKAKDPKGHPGEDIRALLMGYPLDLDLVLAECLAELNQDQSADDFALFLETWRNGDESFYRALDRTAGTKGGVFFFDAMLGDFVAKFVKNESDASKNDIKKSLNAAHDALHEGFLTYRQYRALREAFALSLILGPEVKLPATLERYEGAAAGLFSMRDDVEMLLALSKGDVSLPIQLLTSTAPPMPKPLWAGKYEPLEPFFAAFASKMNDINAAFQSPKNAIAKYRERRAAIEKSIKTLTQKVLTDSGCPAFKDAHN